MVRTKLCSVEAVFLRCEQTLLETDILMAQNLTRLSKQFSDIRHMVEGKGMAQNLPLQGMPWRYLREISQMTWKIALKSLISMFNWKKAERSWRCTNALRAAGD